MEPHPTNFGARLRGLIDRKGQSLTAFADAFGVSESQLHNWLKMAAPPLEKHWAPLAKYFGCSTNYIAFGTPEKSEPVEYTSAGSGNVTAVIRHGSRDPAGELRHTISEMFDNLVAAAGDDVGRLGWIREQLLRYLQTPEHWDAHAEVEKNPKKDKPFFSRKWFPIPTTKAQASK